MNFARCVSCDVPIFRIILGCAMVVFGLVWVRHVAKSELGRSLRFSGVTVGVTITVFGIFLAWHGW